MEKMSDKIFIRPFWGIYNLADREMTGKQSTYSWAIDSEPVRARGIIVKYTQFIEKIQVNVINTTQKHLERFLNNYLQYNCRLRKHRVDRYSHGKNVE